MEKFEGVYISLVTPMTKDYKVDYKRLSEICEWLIGKGVDGLIPAGPLGEYATLSNEERRKVVETVIKASKRRVSVIVGTGASATRDVIDWAKHAKSNEADGILALPPVNYKPLENEVITHFEAISEVGIPIIAFNNPRDFGVDLSPDLLAKISESENIVGVKEFSGDIRRVQEILEKTNLEVFVGVDDLAMEGALCGASGWTSGVSNALPEEGIKLFQLAKERRFEEASILYRDLVKLFHYDANPQLIQSIKYMMELAGQPVGPTRPPRLALTNKAYKEIEHHFNKAINTEA
ncbi:dihydrodipicolinate synthase family protein [Lentibacillus jeotgali]|uniref:dihydrodipicolinate synthase family protein n=1 Tax=Lentibacillus jeotgali TaxID=558169 RepID=UPI00026283E2|nr:dihydrodipicolinate synthase family protein [Lentibacillus jeotgali]